MVGEFLTDAGYFESPPEWGCGWEDLEVPPELVCDTEANIGDYEAALLVGLKWVGKSQSDERAEELTLTLTLLAGED